MDTSKWLDEIDQITAETYNAFGDLTADEIARKPDDNTWSIAENLKHLMQLNKSYFDAIEAIHDEHFRAPIFAKFRPFVAMYEGLLTKAVRPERKKKTKTFDIWKPVSEDYSGILNEFSNHQSKLKKVIEDNSHLLENNTVISSPINKYIVLRLDKAFDMLVSHEQRHLNQAKEVLGGLKTK